ncbi:hypothetical protein O4H61_20285 [Roseovarius aestuarii]|nr:hypothetical protein [Roseovarius aestuarii]
MSKQTNPQKADAIAKRPAPDPLSLSLSWGDDNILRIEALGDYDGIFDNAASQALITGLISQIASLGAQGKRADESASNFVLGFAETMKPRDAAETLLLTQMGATHQAMMMMARRLNHVENIPQQDSAERALNKLGRTFAAQMDTLKRYRSKGQQTVRVERVTIEPGAQAVVGNVHHGGRGYDEI